MNLPTRTSPVRVSSRASSVASSVAVTMVWVLAVAALILLSMQLPNGTAPHQATGAGAVAGGS